MEHHVEMGYRRSPRAVHLFLVNLLDAGPPRRVGISRCTCWIIEHDTLVEVSLMHPIWSCNFCGEAAYTCCPGYIHRKTPVESNQAKLETIFRHCHTQLFSQHDGAPAHKTSSVKQCIVKEFGNQIFGYGVVED
ncbi:hypothetical protein TNCV_4134891 [Trichonephila clavipes]|nr:hypothetical protein TNCV_4134891 [Trichonephila clavipes]